jgi:hypothetical protein
MGNNRSGYDPTNEPTNDDLRIQKYLEGQKRNKEAIDIRDQFIKEKQKQLQKASLIHVWQGKASKVGELI